MPTHTRTTWQSIPDSLDTLDIPEFPWMPNHTIPLGPEIHGFPDTGHPPDCQTHYPPCRMPNSPIHTYPLTEYPRDPLDIPYQWMDTLDIPGLSVDANPYNTPLTEYPRIPWILWTSPDYPWMPTYIIPP